MFASMKLSPQVNESSSWDAEVLIQENRANIVSQVKALHFHINVLGNQKS